MELGCAEIEPRIEPRIEEPVLLKKVLPKRNLFRKIKKWNGTTAHIKRINDAAIYVLHVLHVLHVAYS